MKGGRLPEHKPADGDRGALARPPWLSGEKPSRRVRLGRGRQKDEAAVDNSALDGQDPPDHAARPRKAEPRVVSAATDQVEATPESELPRRVRVPFDRGVRITHPVEPPEAPPQQLAPEPPPLPVVPPPPAPPPRHALPDATPSAVPGPDVAEPAAVVGHAPDEHLASTDVSQESPLPSEAEHFEPPGPVYAEESAETPEPDTVAPQSEDRDPARGTPPPSAETPTWESERWGLDPFPEFTPPSWDSVGHSDAAARQVPDAGPSDIAEPAPDIPPAAPEPVVIDPDTTQGAADTSTSDAFELPEPEPEPFPYSGSIPQPRSEPELEPESPVTADPWPEADPAADDLPAPEAADHAATPDVETTAHDTFELGEPAPESSTSGMSIPDRLSPEPFPPELEEWPAPESPSFELPTATPGVETSTHDTFELSEPELEPEPPVTTDLWPDADSPAFELPTPGAELPTPGAVAEPATPDVLEVGPTDGPAVPEGVADAAADGPGLPEPDEIERRAAALLEAVAAKRSQRGMAQPADDEAAPIVPSPEPPADDELLDDRESTPGVEVSADPDEPTDAETTQTFTDSPVDAGPAIDSTASVGDSLAAPPPESEDLAGPVEAAQGGLATERAAKRAAARKLALPPWQMPSAALPVEFERFGAAGPLTAPDDVALIPEQQPDPPRRHRTPSIPEPPQPVPPPGWIPPAGPGSHGLPPVPFPPPPWWPPPPPGMPHPPPGQGHTPPQPPAQEIADRPAPEPAAPPPPGWVPPPNAVAPPPHYRAPQAFRVPPPLEEAELTDPRRVAPQSGWRRAVHIATSGHVNLGQSRKERQQEQLLAQIRQPIMGDYRIAVLSIKGGVGKTTTTLGLGSALAMVRHDRVIAVDANPDRGTLAERVPDTSTQSTVRDLLSDPHIHRYADVRNHTLMASSRLEVLASEQDPEVSEVFGDTDYRRTIDILRHFYNIILTDCGTGIMHSAMPAILELAHTIVLVSSPAMDAARSASATLDWLMQHGHSGLVREAHVVLSASRPGSAALKLDKLYEHFETRCRSVHLIPFDPHLGEGADVDFGLLKPATMQAYLDLAGAVSEKFGRLQAAREQG